MAEPLGWAEARLEGVPTVLAILSRSCGSRRTAGRWPRPACETCTPSPRPRRPRRRVDAYPDAGGDFAGESRRLGAATAQVHADLATAFGTDELPTGAIGDLTEQMFRKLDLAVSAVPELAKYADMIGEAYSQLAKLSGPVPGAARARRLPPRPGAAHRDRLGGPRLRGRARHPARAAPRPVITAAGRRGDAPLLRLRRPSPAHRPPRPGPLSDAARDWARRNASAFCAGYAAAGGLDPAANQVLLRALQLEKAVYEVLYEARHRPSWLSIPLDSLAEF